MADTKDRIEDFVIDLAVTLKAAKKGVKAAGADEAKRAEAIKEVEEARKSFFQAIVMYRESRK